MNDEFQINEVINKFYLSKGYGAPKVMIFDSPLAAICGVAIMDDGKAFDAMPDYAETFDAVPILTYPDSVRFYLQRSIGKVIDDELWSKLLGVISEDKFLGVVSFLGDQWQINNSTLEWFSGPENGMDCYIFHPFEKYIVAVRKPKRTASGIATTHSYTDGFKYCVA